MNFAKRNKSIVDFLFILALFGAFAITALFVVLFGARIYESTVNNMNSNYEKRTAMSYVTEKIRSHDYTDGVEIDETGSTLKLYQNAGDKKYVTYLFADDGYLKEFTTDEDYDFDYKAGTRILAVNDFSVEKENDSLYRFNITDTNGEKTEFFVTLYSDTDGI
ncbi:MAG: DUF4860 domain-containing protein [Lachnospiraceae bacterium]|jgi:uncharacterized protein YxeA|nr:DUF4860 domain-containing protein [Lachnospiraceae bacterium]MBQ6319399.1 DUF4860 domain-containing protein [Lachnospiraceae bacterium]MBQ8006483.1 DUF4860 domain-containing protein [Lachnospiraceae bacterium]MBQ8666595.1 DUF4860 domain-containing protein [Lachnospiraceae bacterium]MBR1451438.1 DUF4860 domain-containing protein [Lachnospiraceae bacterium]